MKEEKDILYNAFSAYIEKAITIIGNKKAQFEKQKAKDTLFVEYINPIFWLRDRIEMLEASPEFTNLVSASLVAFGGQPIEKLDGSPATYKLQNFFRRSGCYSKIWEEASLNLNVDDYFDQLWAAYNEKEVTTTTLRLLDSVWFPENLIDFGTFKIQKFSKEELDTLCQNKINRLFYPRAKWDTNTLSNFWFIREEKVEERPKVKFEIPRVGSDFSIFQLDPELDEVFENMYKVPREFPDSIIQQLVLFGWDDDYYRHSGYKSDKERIWRGFSVPVTLTTDNDPTSVSPSAPQYQRAGFWVPDIDPRTGEEIDRLDYINLSEDELKELRELLEKAQWFTKIDRPNNWEFLNTAMRYLAKAFFTEGLEQLLWHMTVLESLFGEKSRGIEETVRERLIKALDIQKKKEKTNFRKQFDSLYDFRSELVHGKTQPEQVYTGHLWQARELARRSVVWFINYLLTLYDKLDSAKIPTEEYPQRKEILASLDLEKQEQRRLKLLLETCQDN